MTAPMHRSWPQSQNSSDWFAPDAGQVNDAGQFNESDFGWMPAFRVVRRRWKMILAILLCICLIALPLIMGMEKKYFAQMRVLFSRPPVSEFAGAAAGRVNALDVQVEIERIFSRDTSVAVVERFDLVKNEEFNPDLRSVTLTDTVRQTVIDLSDSSAELEGDPDDQSIDHVLDAYYSALSVARNGASNVVNIGFSSEDPELAAQVPVAIVETYLAQSEARWQGELADALDWLAPLIEKEAQGVASRRAALEKVRAETGVVSIETIAETLSRLTVLETRGTALDRELFEVETALALLGTSGQEPGAPAVQEPPALEELRRELLRETREQERAEATFGENYGGVVSRQARIEDLRADIASELAVLRYGFETRAAGLEEQADEIRQQLARTREVLTGQRRAGLELTRLAGDLQKREDALELLERRQESLIADSGLPYVELHVLSPASVPLGPLGPGRKIIMLAVAVAGLLFALMLAGLAELLDRTVRSHEQLAGVGRFYPVGFLPKPTRRERRDIAGAIRRGDMSLFAGFLTSTVYMTECENNGRFPSSLLIAGPEVDSEAARVADWIAQELVSTGKKVLLADVVRSAPVRPGGPDYTADGPLSDRIRHGERTGIGRLTLYWGPSHAADVHMEISELLDYAKSSGLITIIAAQPLHRPQTLQLAQIAERTLVVMRWGRTQRATMELLNGILAKAGIERVLSVITGVKPARHRMYGFSDRMTLETRRGGRANA